MSKGTRVILPVEAETWTFSLSTPTAAGAWSDGIYGNFSPHTTVAGTYPWVDSDDGESSYVSGKTPLGQNRPNLFAFLPAFSVTEADIAQGKFVVVGRYIEGTSSTYNDPADDDRGVNISAWKADNPAVVTSRLNGLGSQDVSLASYDYERVEQPLLTGNDSEASPADWVAAFAAGNTLLWLVWPLDNFNDLHEWRVTYVALEFPGAVPPLRQRQRDDLRQNQRASRQLTARQRGYF